MATSLNSGFTNNINVVQIRVSGSSMQRVTDRPIDFDGDGSEEEVSIVHVSGDAGQAGGGKIRSTITKPIGIARSVIQSITEPDGGTHSSDDVLEFTEGVE